MKKKHNTKSAIDWEQKFYDSEKQHEKTLDNSVSENLFLIVFLSSLLFLTSTILLAIGGDELTKKVRKFEAYFDRQEKEYEFNNACRRLHSSAIVRYGTCLLNEARMETLEEIKQAELHINLGKTNE